MKRNRSLLTIIGILICMCFSQISNGQEAKTWIKTFGGDEYPGMEYPGAIYQLADSGYVINGADLMKVDVNGDLVWLKQYDLGNGPVGINNMEPTNDDGYILTAYSNINEEWFPSLIKTDNAFDTLWTKTYYNVGIDAFPSSVRQTNDGGFIIAGSCTGDTTYQGVMGGYPSAGILIRTDETGNVRWTKINQNVSRYDDFLLNQDNGFIISPSIGMWNIIDHSGHGTKRSLIRTDSLGNIKGHTFYEYCELSHFDPICKAHGEGVILVGSTALYEREPDIMIANIDVISKREYMWINWSKTYGEDNAENGIAVQPTDDGGYIILGAKRSYYNYGDIFLIKTSSEGNSMWTNTIRHVDSEMYSFKRIKQTNDGGYILAGTIGPSGPGERYLCLIKTDENGNVNEESGVKYASELGVRIYPNPANNLLIIEKANPDSYSFEITSLNGQLIQSGTYAGQSHQIDISLVQTGVYLITIRSQDHVITKKFTKQ